MGKVLFSIKYEIKPEKKDEYRMIIKELKNLIKSDKVSDYRVYEYYNKKNTFEEVYSFNSEEDFENWDDVQTERIELLMKKLGDIIKEQTTEYHRLYELE